MSVLIMKSKSHPLLFGKCLLAKWQTEQITIMVFSDSVDSQIVQSDLDLHCPQNVFGWRLTAMGLTPAISDKD